MASEVTDQLYAKAFHPDALVPGDGRPLVTLEDALSVLAELRARVEKLEAPMGEASETVPDWVMWGASDEASGFMTVGFVNRLVAGSVDVQTVAAETTYPYGPEVPITETGPDRIVGADLKFRAESPPDEAALVAAELIAEERTRVQDEMSKPVEWPGWLSSEYTTMHNAISNEIVRALADCYESADAAGVNWTLDGFVSCSASNILSRLRRDGAPPIPSHETEHLSAEAVEREWEQEDSEDEDEEQSHVLQEGP